MKSLLDMKIESTPAEFATFLREQGEVFWWEKGNFWVVTSHDYARQILCSDDYTCDRTPFFISRMPELDLSLIGDFFKAVSKMMVMSDAVEHTARRRICYDGFTNQTLATLTPFIQQTIAKKIQAVCEKKSLELVADLAQPLPCTVLADFFMIPESERRHFYDWSNNMTQFFGGSSRYQNEDGIKVNASAKALYQYFENLLAERRREEKNDFLSILLRNQNAFGLNDDEIISQAIMMLVAGQITTTDQFCNNVYTLLNEAKDFTLNTGINLDNAINELNRLDPAVTFIFRVTKNDTYIGKQKIKAGDVIFISTHAVNRDPEQFENPNECNLTRQSNRHFSYGFGPHYCIGAKLAQIEMKLCFEQLLNKFSKIELDENDLPVRKHHSLAFSGFEKFPLKIAF